MPVVSALFAQMDFRKQKIVLCSTSGIVLYLIYINLFVLKVGGVHGNTNHLFSHIRLSLLQRTAGDIHMDKKAASGRISVPSMMPSIQQTRMFRFWKSALHPFSRRVKVFLLCGFCCIWILLRRMYPSARFLKPPKCLNMVGHSLTF